MYKSMYNPVQNFFSKEISWWMGLKEDPQNNNNLYVKLSKVEEKEWNKTVREEELHIGTKKIL